MNFIKQIIDFLKSIFGGKAKKKSSSTASKPKSTSTQPTPAPNTPRPQSPPVETPPTSVLPEMPITESTMNQTLLLGAFDKNSISSQKIEPLLQIYHKRIIDASNWISKNSGDQAKKDKASKMLQNAKTKLRSGDTFSWVNLKPMNGNAVKTLQTFLVNAGIFPKSANIDGFFGYATQAGVRLFQEYERVYGNNPGSVPNGIVDKNTWNKMKTWQQTGKTAKKWTRGKPSVEYKKWIQMLENGRSHYLNQSNERVNVISKKIDELNTNNSKKVDTIKINDWHFNQDDVHLIGVRRNEDQSATHRKNDDLFILLINGMVFKFWGSTDPNQKYAGRKDEAFLVEGQHKFRFGWHKITNSNKLYQGLNPYDRGVLVFRDDKSINDNRLTEADIQKGIDNTPNQSINIHWSGIGQGTSGSWSSGCQVMASKNYIDNEGTQQDCSGFLCGSYDAGRAQKEDNISKTMAAYNMFTDLVLCFRPKPVDYIYYTLARDESLEIEAVTTQGGDQIVSDSLRVFNIPRG